MLVQFLDQSEHSPAFQKPVPTQGRDLGTGKKKHCYMVSISVHFFVREIFMIFLIFHPILQISPKIRCFTHVRMIYESPHEPT